MPIAQALVDVVDEMGQRHRDHEIEDAGQQQRRQIAGDDGLVLADTEQFALGGQQAEEVDEARILDVADELVHQRRQDAADALRDDHEAHALAVAHAERTGGVDLAALDALDAGAEDLADVGAGDQAEGQNAQRIGRGTEQIACRSGRSPGR